MFKAFEGFFKKPEAKMVLPLDNMTASLRETALEDRQNFHWLNAKLNKFLFGEKGSL